MTEEKKKNNNKKFNRGAYTVGVCGIVLLVMIAFFGPQVVFTIQDNYRLGSIWQGTRNGLDMETIYSTYGSLRDRLEAFAERLEEDYEFYVAGTEYQITSELLDMLEVIVAQEGYEVLMEYGVAPYLSAVKNRGYTIDAWKKYVIYNDISEGDTNAVVVSGWYIAFTTRADVTVRMLVDTETYELYFMQIIDPEYLKNAEYWEALHYVDYFLASDWLSYWFDYYEAGQTLVQTYEGYMKGASIWENAGVEVTEKGIKGILVEYKTGPTESQGIRMDLPYGNYYLKWQASVRTQNEKKGPAVFSIGMTDIAELIPELQ